MLNIGVEFQEVCMYRMIFLAYKKHFKKSFVQCIGKKPIHMRVIFYGWAISLILTVCSVYSSFVSNTITMILSSISVLMALIMYTVSDKYSVKNVENHIEVKRKKVKELYALLKHNNYFTKNRIKQLHNELQVEINKERTKIEKRGKIVFKIFELIFVLVALVIFTKVSELNNIGTPDILFPSVDSYIYFLFIVIAILLPLYSGIMKISSRLLEEYEMFSEDLQDVLDIQFRTRNEDIIDIK